MEFPLLSRRQGCRMRRSLGAERSKPQPPATPTNRGVFRKPSIERRADVTALDEGCKFGAIRLKIAAPRAQYMALWWANATLAGPFGYLDLPIDPTPASTCGTLVRESSRAVTGPRDESE